MDVKKFLNRHFFRVLLSIGIFFVLYAASVYNALLFHILAELTSIILAAAVFVLAWNFRRFYHNNFQILIASAYLAAGFFDVFHMVTAPGMDILPAAGDLSVQFWLTARVIQSVSLFLAPYFLRLKANMVWTLGAFGLIVFAIFGLTSTRVIFPQVYSNQAGLASLQDAAEIMLAGVLFAAAANLALHRKWIDRVVMQWMLLAIITMLFSQISFALKGYVNPFGFIFGHFLKIVSAYLVYKAIIETEAGSIYADMTRFRETERALLQSTHELRENEMAARRSLAELRSIYATAPVGLCFLDSQNMIQAINEDMASLIGCAARECLGKYYRDVLPAGSADQFTALLQQVVHTGEPVGNQVISEPQHADPAQRVYWSVRFHPVVDNKGVYLGTSCVLQDITARWRSEMALQASERNLKLFLAYAPTAIAMFDRDMQYVAGSQKFIDDYRVDSGAIAGRVFTDIVPNMSELWRTRYQNCLAGSVEKQDEEMIQQPDGSVEWFRWEMHPWYDHLGAVGGIIIFSEVITSRKQAEEELNRAHAALQDYAQKLTRSNQELEQFAIVASHDLQEPLRKIQFFGANLVEQYNRFLPGEAYDDIQRIQNAVERMQSMIDGLLELSRVTTRGGNFARTDLTAIANDVLSDLEPRIRATGGTVVVDPLPFAEVDEVQIRRLFQNLVGNALKFHRKGVPPEVRITSRVSPQIEAGQVAVVVQDNGIGFDETYASRIFQPFQRLHGRTEYEGTGLGLAISQKIVERHHGKLEVHSQPGQGSEFIVTLPSSQLSSNATL